MKELAFNFHFMSLIHRVQFLKVFLPSPSGPPVYRKLVNTPLNIHGRKKELPFTGLGVSDRSSNIEF
jgi:hypothetical protein